ncbi:uncharacterized protein LOC129732105 [Wyeomyia smithii]|uniref:uncharacterized protein LOC129732105 n=1 Tax=Wyeomyia smithii TaxID=174621 RepID=UPI0024680391|nr:uncharacterized protein LOC129732105 [Wyeomyia smithii]
MSIKLYLYGGHLRRCWFFYCRDAALKDTIGGDLARHQSISAYKKRQLYSSGYQHLAVRNHTNERSYDRQNLVKEFIPSPELIQLHNTEGSYHTYHQGRNIHQVDAPYPSNAADHDSRWYGGNHLNFPVVSNADKLTDPSWPSKGDHDKYGKHLWLPNNGQTESDSPFSKVKPPSKGKWKWVPEEHGSSHTATVHAELPPVENSNSLAEFDGKIVAAPHQHQPLKFPGRDRPYLFDSATGGIEEPGSAAGVVPSTLDYFSGGGAKLPTSGKGDETALKHVSPWKKIFHVLTAAIPIGLIISALTPQVVYINPNMTQTPVQMQTPTPISATGASGTRQRAAAIGHHRSLLDYFAAGGAGCEEKSFCELTRLGINPEADILAKTLWKVANETPSDRARQSGLEEIFRAAKDNDCSRFRCENT